MTSDNGKCPTMDLEGKPSTPKYEIGSLWRGKNSGTIYELWGEEDDLYVIYDTEDKKKRFTRKDGFLKHYEPYTKTNKWNDYDPNVEPEVGRWIEWSEDKTDDEPSRVVKPENESAYSLYFPSKKITSYDFSEWKIFRTWGQWRYCDAPDVNDTHVVDIPEAVESEEKDTLTAEQFLEFAEGIKGLHPRAETINYEECDKETDRLGLPRLTRIVSIPDGVVTEDILKSHPQGTMFKKSSTPDSEELYPIKDINNMTAELFYGNKSNVQNMHNGHYEALAPHKPWDVFEVWVKANEDLFKQHPTLSGYYSPVLKYLGRLTTKEGESPVKNLEKARNYLDKMIQVLKIK